MAQKTCPDCKCVVQDPQDGCPFCSNTTADLREVNM